MTQARIEIFRIIESDYLEGPVREKTPFFRCVVDNDAMRVV